VRNERPRFSTLTKGGVGMTWTKYRGCHCSWSDSGDCGRETSAPFRRATTSPVSAMSGTAEASMVCIQRFQSSNVFR